jgi:hypothetical protein
MSNTHVGKYFPTSKCLCTQQADSPLRVKPAGWVKRQGVMWERVKVFVDISSHSWTPINLQTHKHAENTNFLFLEQYTLPAYTYTKELCNAIVISL